MASPPASPFQTLLKRGSIRLENFFHRCEDMESALFVDPGLDIVISRIVHPNVIQQCFKKVFTYQSNRSFFDYDKILIFTTGQTSHLTEYVNLLTSTEKPPRQIVVVFSNRFTFIARQFFEMRGFLHMITTEELRLPAWILDPDLATIELPFSFSNLYIDGGAMCVEQLNHIVKSFPVFEHFTNVFMVGKAAMEVGASLPVNFHSAWTHMLIFDRRIDSVTPFLTATSYEAVVAELNGMNYGISKSSRGDYVLFADSDTVSAQIRNLPFDEASNYAVTLFQETSNDFKKGEKNVDMETFRKINETAVQNVSIGDHIDILDGIPKKLAKDPNMNKNLTHELDCILGKQQDLEFVKESVALAPTWHTPVRLLALFCLTTSKIPDLDEVRQMIIDRFGVEALAALWSLEEAGIVVNQKKRDKSAPKEAPKATSNPASDPISNQASNPTPNSTSNVMPAHVWAGVMKKFQLYTRPVEKNYEKPYDGFTPLVGRILQKIFKKQTNDIIVSCEQLGVPLKIEANRCPDTKRVMVVFIGGVTYGELAVLRHLVNTFRINIDVLTTQILSSKSLLEQLAGIEFSS